MDIQERCYEVTERVSHLKSIRQFFYMREIEPPSSPMVTMNGKKLINLGSNNYLGLTFHPRVIEATVKATEKYGTGSCSSRILAGTSGIHRKLEKKLADSKGTEDAVVFSTGYMTMMGTIATITKEDDLILSDDLNHASIVEGCRLSKAEVRRYRHNDMSSLEEELYRCEPSRNKLIVTDGVFSMDGTVARLPEIKKLAEEYDAMIMVDDAHGTGVLGETGRGTLEHFGLEGQIDIVSGTFSKSLGTIGGVTCSNSDIVTYLKLQSRPFIFSASPPPSVAATVLAALEVIEDEPELLRKLHQNANTVKRGLLDSGFMLEETITPIIPLLVNDEEKTFKLTRLLEDDGVFVNPIIPPAVPKESSLIRISILASHTDKDLEYVLSKFKKYGRKLGII
jgi:8-amino-7-oxononanoate synthase